MYTQLLRTKGVAVGLYLALFAAFAWAAHVLLDVLVGSLGTPEMVLFGVPAAVALMAPGFALYQGVLPWLVTAAKDALEPRSERRSWLPRSRARLLRLHWRCSRSSAAVQEVFRTLVSDSVESGSSPDGFETLDAAEALVGEGGAR